MTSVRVMLVAASVFLAACSGGGDGGSTNSATLNPSPTGTGSTPPPVTDTIFETEDSTSRFLSQATFGATEADINALTGTDASDWLVSEFDKPITSPLQGVLDFLDLPGSMESDGVTFQGRNAPGSVFWLNAIEADDQLRQRTAFALSQIFVVSNNESNSLLWDYPTSMGHFQEVLATNAFGNFRDLLEDVTYSPAMGVYLTYWQNQKEDAETGRMPDENYARELMQLFTIGLVELNRDGTPKLGSDGNPIETYDNDDVTGLAKVFTGLSLDSDGFFKWIGNVDRRTRYSPMIAFSRFHSTSEKVFLDTSIPSDTSAEVSIDHALDTLFNHPNVGPFVGRQLVQRFTTSNPSSDYVERVATAFEEGSYMLPNDEVVGTGERGDMRATIAAVLMDEEARQDPNEMADTQGRVREPILRFIQWARAFDARTVTPQNTYLLYDTSGPQELAQHPYKSLSVFNFYRPGYVAPGTLSGAAGLTTPELQIMNASSVNGYANFMTFFIFGFAANGDEAPANASFIPDYVTELPLANDPEALLDHLDTLLANGELSESSKSSIVDVIEGYPLGIENDPEYDGANLRVATAILMVMTSPDYLVQQ